jgi:hypothetical protein
MVSLVLANLTESLGIQVARWYKFRIGSIAFKASHKISRPKRSRQRFSRCVASVRMSLVFVEGYPMV